MIQSNLDFIGTIPLVVCLSAFFREYASWISEVKSPCIKLFHSWSLNLFILVALLNSKKESTVVDNVQPHYGEPKALGYAKVYETVEDLEYIETKSVIAKNTEASEEAEENEE